MAALGAVCYDPAVAVTKVTDTLIAMTALDTTNLRINFTVPSTGRVLVRMAGVIHGSVTPPMVLFGVLEGATVRGRVAPAMLGPKGVATDNAIREATFIVGGLTPGANLNWDAAYGVEVVSATTGVKYGGPNNAVTNDAFGGFCFEIWPA